MCWVRWSARCELAAQTTVRQARSAQRQVLFGRSAGSARGGARARRAPRHENETATTLQSRSRKRPSAVSVARSLGQLREADLAASWSEQQLNIVAYIADACSVGGLQVLSGALRSQAACSYAARHGTRTRRQRRSEAAAETDRARCRWRGAVRWSTPRVGRAGNRAPSTQRAETRPLWAVGWFCTWRSARAPRATARERDGNDVPKPQPKETERCVGGEER